MVLSSLLVVLASSISGVRLVTVGDRVPFPTVGESVSHEFELVKPDIEFNEAIVSWNVQDPALAEVVVMAKAVKDGVETKEFNLGDWTYDTALHPRASLNGQADATGTVLTDTLHLKTTADALKLRLVLKTLKSGPVPTLKLVTVCFSNTAVASSDAPQLSPAWGKDIPVPERAQNNYPDGGVLCSATSISMLLSHWSKELKQPELDHDVPEVQSRVWDSVYKGAGNWPFNTAYAGSLPGLVGYVSRFNGIADLEKWIDKGMPVACSVSFDMLRGKPLSPTESGHLIVLTGFTLTGDPIVNDPAFKDGVHKTYPRSDFEKAWVYSHRTVYLIYPESAKTPENPDHLWIGP